jgi:aminopeptidase N
VTHSNLTRAEAGERARLLGDIVYDVALDLTTGDSTFECDTTIEFSCKAPGSDTFIDLIAERVHAIELNGQALGAGSYDAESARVTVRDLASHNVVRVRSTCRYENTGVGLHRFVDPVDGRVYLYTQFEPFDAHRMFACFDQPDLKGRLGLSVIAPEDWEVVSNGACAGAEGGRRRFETTPPVPPYITALVAGPYHAVRASHEAIGLGLYCRQSST